MAKSKSPIRPLPPEPAKPSSTGRTLCAVFVLAAITWICYFPIWDNGYVYYDDPIYITDNPHVKHGWSWESMQWAFLAGHATNWHPITWISHILDAQLFGLNPRGSHGVNLLLHTLNSILLFLFLRKITGRAGLSWIAAAIFSIHPVHVESVAWASERKDVLSTFFFLLTLTAYVHYCRHRNWLRYLWVFFLFMLGLMAKPMLVTLPFLLMLLDIWPLGRSPIRISSLPPGNQPIYGPSLPLRTLVIEKLPLLFLSLLSCVITYIVQQQGGAMDPMEKVSFTMRLSNALVSYISYLKTWIFPANLAVLYPYPQTGIALWKAALAAGLLVLITAGVISRMRRHPYLAIGWFWYVGTMVPVIGLVQVGFQAKADRYLYIPSMGLLLLMVWAIGSWFRPFSRKSYLSLLTSMALLIVLGVVTYRQAGYWKNDETLFGRALAVTQNNYICHNNYARDMIKKGNLQEALRHNELALQANPQYAEALVNIGMIYGIQGFPDKSEQYYLAAIERRPDLPASYNNLAWLYATSKQETYRKPSQALELAEKAAQLTQYKKPDILDTLAAACAANGDFSNAIVWARKALDIAQIEEHLTLEKQIRENLSLYQKHQSLSQ